MEVFMHNQTKGVDYLWLVFFLIVFINGFEAGGYQASLWNIGQTYDLSTSLMGLFASVELFATMLAPLLLGAWADRNNKIRCLKILLCVQTVAAVLALASGIEAVFLTGVFFLGMTTSALQFIAIAALADSYPVSHKKKIGFMTSMYAFGAFISPLIVSFYLNLGMGWRTLFALLVIGSVIAFLGLQRYGQGTLEVGTGEQEETGTGSFILVGVLLLCVIMCVYVGFENGFAFFVDTMFTDVFKVSTGKFALSLFWMVMIPSRMMVGKYAHKAETILLASVAAIPLITFLISLLNNSTAVMILCIPLGIASGAIYPSVLTILMPFAGSHKAAATGMITTATGIGGVVFTALTGFVGDHYGMRTAMAVLAACFLLSLAAVFALRKMREKLPQ